ncbi:hypothetical protein PI95_031770 [Hassallia byssoidea VB512170]|uniref:Uncharacterized protein n=1 Tax=Hassallia byssoidea VB512170 TaxID=1304833 RepID=A0A846HIT5_9CYAN|nr:hypothetical protein [Hassalia byssoidea]NEU76953.1 hypothetical protein [Hassalia byssoidea VB512170]
MVRERFKPLRNDPNLPEVNIPFKNPFNHQPLFAPNPRPKTRGWQDDADVDWYFDGCNNGIRINSLGIDFIRRNPNCPVPFTEIKNYFPPPLPPVIEPVKKPPPFVPTNYGHCGQLTLHVAFGYLLLGYGVDPLTERTIALEIPVGVDACANKYMECVPSFKSKQQVLESANSTGFGNNFQINGVQIRQEFLFRLEVNHDCASLQPPFGQYSYPVYMISQQYITVFDPVNLVMAELFSRITTSSRKPEVTILNSASDDRSCHYPPLPPDPPPPPPPYMQCCPNVEQNDQLLRLILKRIGEPKTVTIFDEDLDRKGAQKANKTPESLNDYLKLAVERIEIANRIVGIENFPITVPDTMIEPYKEGAFSKIFGFINGDKKRKIKTIAEFIAWMSEQDSAVLGEFHQVIEYESGEKGKDGKPKKKTLVLPNVAETLKEITLLVAQMAKQNNTQTEVLFKALFEIVATRAEATKGTAIVQDIQDFLDYPTETKSVQYGSSVSIPNYQVNKEGKPLATETTEDHKNLLKPGKVRYVYEDWTGDSSFHDQMIDLLQMASMLRAVLYQRTDK